MDILLGHYNHSLVGCQVHTVMFWHLGFQEIQERHHSFTVLLAFLQDSGTRKAALLVQYVDLHNDYVHDRRQHKTRFLELFQTFR